eukprot:2629408-Rhodomonas_salina.1
MFSRKEGRRAREHDREALTGLAICTRVPGVGYVGKSSTVVRPYPGTRFAGTQSTNDRRRHVFPNWGTRVAIPSSNLFSGVGNKAVLLRFAISSFNTAVCRSVIRAQTRPQHHFRQE